MPFPSPMHESEKGKPCTYDQLICSVIKKNEILPLETTWTDLEGILLSEISQARILEWVAISFSRGSSQPRDRTRVSCIAGRRFGKTAVID